MSEESIQDNETEESCEKAVTVNETHKDEKAADKLSVKGSEDSLAALDQIDIAMNGESNDAASDFATNVLENLQFIEANFFENDLFLPQGDGNLADNETESDVNDVECKRTSETKTAEDELKELSSDTEESDFRDAQAINGIEMLPSSAVNNEDSEESDQTESPTKETSNEADKSSKLESSLSNNAPKDSLVENTESSNEENAEEAELQRVTDSSQDDLLPSSADTAADSSSYETPRSSEESPSATSGNQSEMITTQPTVTINGVQSRNSVVTDGAPIPPPRKSKKKGVAKGLSSSSLGGCLPMACAGNTSPTFNLSRVDSVYGGSVRSRLVKF